MENSRVVLLQWGDLKRKFFDVARYGRIWSSQGSAVTGSLAQMNRYPDQQIGDFYGKYNEGDKNRIATGQQTFDWVDNGYWREAFQAMAERVPMGMQRRAHWNDEEGDIEISRLAAGWDDFYLGMEEMPSKPGIRIQFAYCFNCTVPNEVISEYGGFLMSLIAGMESMGFDLTVDALLPVGDLFRDDEYGMTTNVLIRVKRAGEASDATEWSSLFSPIGFRVLGFTALGMAGDKLGKRCTSALGHAKSGYKWDLDYDQEKAILTVKCNSNANSRSFPTEDLVKKAIEAGLLPGDQHETERAAV